MLNFYSCFFFTYLALDDAHAAILWGIGLEWYFTLDRARAAFLFGAGSSLYLALAALF